MIKTGLTAVFASFLMLTGCGSHAEGRSAVSVQSETASVRMQNDSSNTAAQQAEKDADGMPAAFETNGSLDTEFTAQDVCNLCDFLLAKPAAGDLQGKPYDLDSDGVWSVLDLCLMKRKIMEQRSMTAEFDFESKTVLLNSGYEMPILGLGTWTQDDDTAESSVYEALKDGYRLIDTAQYYGNETGVGRAFRGRSVRGLSPVRRSLSPQRSCRPTMNERTARLMILLQGSDWITLT